MFLKTFLFVRTPQKNLLLKFFYTIVYFLVSLFANYRKKLLKFQKKRQKHTKNRNSTKKNLGKFHLFLNILRFLLCILHPTHCSS